MSMNFYHSLFVDAFICLFGKTKSTNQLINESTGSVENIGVEPMTSCVQGRRSSQLS
jgi:hypothetical protein